MRGLLVLLKSKGIVTAGEIVAMLHTVESESAVDPRKEAQVHSAYVWLRTPHLAESASEFSKVIGHHYDDDLPPVVTKPKAG